MTVVFAEGKNVVLIVKDNIGEKSKIRRLNVFATCHCEMLGVDVY